MLFDLVDLNINTDSSGEVSSSEVKVVKIPLSNITSNVDLVMK